MAITGTDRGTGTNNTSSTTTAFSPASNFAAGSMAILCVSADNSAASGATNNINSVADSHGNTWTKRIAPLYDPGAAAAGIQGATFECAMDVATLTTGSTITITFGVATVADTWTLMELVPTAGSRIEYVTGGVNTGSATASPTVTTASITSGDIVIGMLCNEYGTAQTVTGDADATDGSWSTQQTAEIGTTAAGNTISTQRKVVTATATQTYNPTLLTSSDVILGWVVYTEVVIPAVTGSAWQSTLGGWF